MTAGGDVFFCCPLFFCFSLTESQQLLQYVSVSDTSTNKVVNITFSAKEHNLSSPVIVGENAYLAAKVKREGRYEIAYGYSFEKVCLYALSLGIGTVMLAASLSRSTFEQAMDGKSNEVAPCGKSGRISVREKIYSGEPDA